VRLLLFAGNSAASVELIADDVARVRWAGGQRRLSTDASWAVTGRFTPPAVSMNQTDTAITLKTRSIVVTIGLQPLRLRFTDPQGRLINQDSKKGMCWSGKQIRVWKTKPPGEQYLGFGEKSGRLDRSCSAVAMWNSDIPAYTPDTDPLYQSIPFFYSICSGAAHGIFLDNPFRSSFDMGKESRDEFSFGAEDGELNYYVFAGPEPKAVLQRYTELVGRMPLPPRWSLGYQQCKWSYTPDARVKEIASRFRSLRIPCDVIYLDIDYMEGFRVFTWNSKTFPQPRNLIRELADQGFKTVVIIDPGIKADSGYTVFRSGVSGNHFIRKSDGSLYFGDVWPGQCAFPDFSNAGTRRWWGQQFAGLLADGVRGWWNDMNEPSVFNTPTKSIDLAAVHQPDFGPTTHAGLHNVYGMQMTRATYDGVRSLLPDRRPFVLTRASYAGGQRYAAAWTGDNVASWEHLKMALTMCLNLSVSGQPFVGADIGGFIGVPSGELFARWLQLGVFTPLMRAHSAIRERDKEPWEYGKRFTDINRETISLRYRLLPYIYTVMEQSSRTGLPAMRPVVFMFPGAGGKAWVDDEFLFGNDILVAPALSEGMTVRSVYLPPGDWYEFSSSKRFRGDTTLTTEAPIESIPFFVRAGSVLPTQQLVQYSDESPIDSLLLYVYPPPPGGTGISEYYEDDGVSFRYQTGEYLRRTIEQRFEQNRLTVALAACEGTYIPTDRRLILHIITGRHPHEVRVDGSAAREQTVVTGAQAESTWHFDEKRGILSVVLRDTRKNVTVIIQG
jgi:alpha-glucosidase